MDSEQFSLFMEQFKYIKKILISIEDTLIEIPKFNSKQLDVKGAADVLVEVKTFVPVEVLSEFQLLEILNEVEDDEDVVKSIYKAYNITALKDIPMKDYRKVKNNIRDIRSLKSNRK